MATIETIADAALAAGDFTGTAEMHGALLLEGKEIYYGTLSVKKCEISSLVDTCGEQKGAEFVYTAALRCIGRECGYSDAAELDRRIALVCSYLLKDSTFIVRNIVRGELERNTVTGRLERVVTFTLAGYGYFGEDRL